MKHLLKNWKLRLTIAAIIIFGYVGTSYGQANLLTIFGNAGCSHTNRMSCLATPSSSSFTGLSTFNDVTAPSAWRFTSADFPAFYKNSVYNRGGQLLFYVNANGIYAPDASGTQVFSFGGTGYYSGYTCGSSAWPYAITPTYSMSEIVSFPKPGTCNSFYVCYWTDVVDGSSTSQGAWLRVVEVAVNNATFGTSASPSTWYTFSNNFLTTLDCSGAGGVHDPHFVSETGGTFEIVADALNSDGSRDLYTINPYYNSGTTYSELRQWHISSTGVLPVNSSTTLTSDLPKAFTTKAKIFEIDGDKIFTYVTGDASWLSGDEMITYNLTSSGHEVYHYIAPTLDFPSGYAVSGPDWHFQTIWGFEYLADYNVFCIAYEDNFFSKTFSGGGPTGGLAYVTPLTSTVTTANMTAIPSTTNYYLSDLELDKNGDMLLVYDDLTGGVASMAYIPAASLTSSFTSTSSTRLYYGSACSGTPPISSNNFQSPLGGFTNYGHYLGSQIRGEDYNTWGEDYDIGDYVVSGSENWTPTSNPVTAATGLASVSTLIAKSIQIQPGASLIINGMTIQMRPGSEIEIQCATSTSTAGGILSVINSELTAYRGCDGTEHSTWAGIKVMGGGDAVPLGSSFSWPGTYPQGAFVYGNATISYADIGVQNGDDVSTSGGIIMPNMWGGMTNHFLNNVEAVKLWPYHNIVGGTEYSSALNFRYITFENNSDAWFASSHMVAAYDIKNAFFYQCTFTNTTGSIINAGINSFDAGMQVQYCNFNNFTNGISAFTGSGTRSINASFCTFNDEHVGVGSWGGVAPMVSGNTFNVPEFTGVTVRSRYGTGSVRSSDPHIGALMVGSYGYSIIQNIFQTDATVTLSNPDGYYESTTGTLQDNTTSHPHQVTGNTFTGLQVAMNSNFNNKGLQYLCNNSTRVGYDISVLGASAGEGIASVQATSTGTGSGSVNNRSAGNRFSTHDHLYNMVDAFHYQYHSSTPGETPSYITGSVTTSDEPPAVCYTVGGDAGPYVMTAASDYFYVDGGASYSTGWGEYDPRLKSAVATANVNYYMTDSAGSTHRDSLYYWAGQMGTAYGDLLIANLLIEDSHIDSANTIYDSILYKYSLDTNEANEFTQGRTLMDLLIYKRTNNRNPMSLTSGQVTTLTGIRANTKMWAHARAEGWLYMYDNVALSDTFLYPEPDTSAPRPAPYPKVVETKVENKVYPNPAHDELYVLYTGQTNDAIVMQIEDVSGRILVTQSLTSAEKAKVDISRLAPGMYLYRILEGKKVTMIGKVAKE